MGGGDAPDALMPQCAMRNRMTHTHVMNTPTMRRYMTNPSMMTHHAMPTPMVPNSAMPSPMVPATMMPTTVTALCQSR